MRLHARGTATALHEPVIGRITTIPAEPGELTEDSIIYTKDGNFPFPPTTGHVGMLCTKTLRGLPPAEITLPTVVGVKGLDYLTDGDVVAMRPDGSVNVLYRKNSRHNTILTTERCNSLCLMCSQPPKEIDDSYHIAEILKLLELIDKDCVELGISGGEPTLLGENFLRIIDKSEKQLPSTALHVLTNGRLFAKRSFATSLGSLEHHDLMLGIPLYSDIDSEHDYVVQARGAFDETILGLYNLAEAGVRIEIRVVLHALTYKRLPQLANFIYRNLPFASHVALMGLEMFGFVHQNLSKLWIDPAEYKTELSAAVRSLALRNMKVSIYNHQLCTVPKELWPFTRKSISDWKNVYLDVCDDCGVRELCGGFFQSATKTHSSHIAPLEPIDDDDAFRLREFTGA